jgi:hypothetical protein
VIVGDNTNNGKVTTPTVAKGFFPGPIFLHDSLDAEGFSGFFGFIDFTNY